LAGSGAAIPDASGDFRYPGHRLGAPESGPGSVGRIGRRLIALVIDWYASVGVAAFLGQGLAWAGPLRTSAILTLLSIFFFQITLMTWLAGGSIGQRIMRVRVVKMATGRSLGLGAAIIRTLLVMLVIPAVVYDRDQRGLHDRAVGSLVIRG
jgi:hypothetical protein